MLLAYCTMQVKIRDVATTEDTLTVDLADGRTVYALLTGWTYGDDLYPPRG